MPLASRGRANDAGFLHHEKHPLFAATSVYLYIVFGFFYVLGH